MPLHVIYVNSGNSNSVTNTRSFINIQGNAEVTLIESFYNIGSAKVFSNFVSEKFVGECKVDLLYISKRRSVIIFGEYKPSTN